MQPHALHLTTACPRPSPRGCTQRGLPAARAFLPGQHRLWTAQGEALRLLSLLQQCLCPVRPRRSPWLRSPWLGQGQASRKLLAEAITRTHGKRGNFGMYSQLVEGKAQAPNTKSLNLSKAVLLHSDTFNRLNHPRHITLVHGKYTVSYCILKHIIAYFKVKLNVFCTYLVPCSISISPVP